ncbi:AraC family transcriptional regulator [Burkholderia ubonensis]|uniref:AraC family transcriptional regulator n=1 Tax=Burkholderia ubonensis TaxID=101571 RepID=UPI00075892E7|nr:AraC family transcriptional regulator [Burkholderia ubonensis]KWI90926.1 AraC family transcriptional regulator [Burkholderia ubonensis]KWI97867.1 AraC family transcriptional regulator [Burkholderia ubonensis]KWK13041.1 AraC family transcriptional regulator [Burkholderia ubonensis]KWK39628.1 AraC family transcriptional regulator [Burkholderia ubonensis]KWK40044.1 AraC family transcriptional regulator [Burkholderia ubonensis]
MTGSTKQTRSDWISRSEATQGIERIEAYFRGNAYSMHRHDTYAIGLTLAGVQCFHYRRSLRSSVPGQTMVLHPDEAHDGQAGTHEGFRYQMIYVQPAAIQAVLGGKPLPFIDGGVTTDPRLFDATRAALSRMRDGAEPLERDDAIVDLALALDIASGARPTRKPEDFAAVQRAREYLQDACTGPVTLDTLAAISGRDRWSLSRDFRTFYGTSPYRYLTMRRLEAARAMMLRGVPLADAAVAAGFSDQSHMTRHFRSAYGISPARWLTMTGQPRAD